MGKADKEKIRKVFQAITELNDSELVYFQGAVGNTRFGPKEYREIVENFAKRMPW